MSAKTSKEICEELEQIGEVLADALSREGGIYLVDLDYFAGAVHDLKQELRIAKAREHH